MRRLAVAVFGSIAVVVAAASAYAVENSSWYTSGHIWVDIRMAGQPRFMADGPFESAYTGVFTNQAFLSFDGEIAFTNNVTATADVFYPGTPTFEPVKFTQTTAKFKVDFAEAPGAIDYSSIIRNFTDNIVTELLDVPVTFVDPTSFTGTAGSFDGIALFEPTLKAGGKARAFNDFTEIDFGAKIQVKGKTFPEGDTKTKGRAVKVTIKVDSKGS